MKPDTNVEHYKAPEPNLEAMQRADLPAIWEDYRAQAEKLKVTAETLVVTDASQTAEMKIARTTRLMLRSLRVAIENKRKELGEYHLRQTQKINSDAKALKELIEPLEERLLLQEQFVERKEAERKARLKEEREGELRKYVANPEMFHVEDMDEETYLQLYNGQRAAHEAKIAAEKQAEEERIAKEKADAEERERIRLENERLRKEAEAREAEAQKEREKAAAALKAAQENARKELKEAEAKAKEAANKARKEREVIEAKAKAEREAAEVKAAEERRKADEIVRKEREAREKIEEELAAKKAAEERAESERLAREEAEAAAPDKAKITAFAETVRSLTVPQMKTKKGQAAQADIVLKVEGFAAWIEKKAATL